MQILPLLPEDLPRHTTLLSCPPAHIKPETGKRSPSLDLHHHHNNPASLHTIIRPLHTLSYFTPSDPVNGGFLSSCIITQPRNSRRNTMLLLSLLCSCLLVSLASPAHLDALPLSREHYHESTPCQPQHNTITVTSTQVDTDLGKVTQYDCLYNQHTVDVSSILYLPSTLTETVQVTKYTDPEIVTRFSYLTSTVYQTVYKTSVATDVATVTSRVLVTDVEVEEFIITHTNVVDQPETKTITVTSLDSSITSIITTEFIKAFVTQTQFKPFHLTQTSTQTWHHQITQTETSTSTQTIDATVTITDRQYITKCALPKITYGH
ncbi:hypothetical protein Pmani_033833 [Petrolisthes manimaculis]|uniref:Uncharacterized protein n=1 Tax=Petrolisthes manimaculis TaxID=1843537 RepID=A0AAE1TQ09_9EUCA|nr:hypothetical protein Pmani_033833 [Petrolisthes manimaculis]